MAYQPFCWCASDGHLSLFGPPLPRALANKWRARPGLGQRTPASRRSRGILTPATLAVRKPLSRSITNRFTTRVVSPAVTASPPECTILPLSCFLFTSPRLYREGEDGAVGGADGRTRRPDADAGLGESGRRTAIELQQGLSAGRRGGSASLGGECRPSRLYPWRLAPV